MADVVDRIGEYMLTTVDNPFSPFTQWVEWYAYDTASGYHTCALLARIAITSDELLIHSLEQSHQLHLG